MGATELLALALAVAAIAGTAWLPPPALRAVAGFWLALASVTGVLAFVWTQREHTSPGPLSATHAAVAELADGAACAACHGEGDVTLADACGACPAGEYVNTTGNTACTKCAAGYWQGSTGSPLCVECAEGKYTDREGESVCLDCEAVTFANTTAPSPRAAT